MPVDPSEQARIEDIAADSWYSRGVNTDTIVYSASVFKRHFRGGSCLELGPAEGVMTQLLISEFDTITLVEGSARFCDDLRRRFPQAIVVNSLFEEFDTSERFDAIVLGHVLEHVENPVSLLTMARTWLATDGILCVAVPNALSIHRQAAVLMGLLGNEHELNDTDMRHGHRRVYDPQSLRADFDASGLTIVAFGGYWLKPLSNAQIEATWSEKMLDAFMRLGERLPDIAGELYAIARR